MREKKKERKIKTNKNKLANRRAKKLRQGHECKRKTCNSFTFTYRFLTEPTSAQHKQ